MKHFPSARLTSISFAILLFAGLSFLSTECQAQKRRFVPGQQLGRWLGAGYGVGYHCANPGQNTGYYNPYSAHNSQRAPNNRAFGYDQQRYWDSSVQSVPHSSYTGRDPQQHSVFESLPGQSIRPSFQPAEDRVRKQEEEENNDFQSDIGFDVEPETQRTADSFEPSSEFDTDRTQDFSDDVDDAASEMGSAIEEMEDALGNAGDFDSLKDTFDRLRDDSKTPAKPDGDSFGESLLE